MNYYNCADTPEKKFKYANILQNIKLAANTNRPLCQDTGQVIVFVKIGRNVCVEGMNVEQAINIAVEKTYSEQFYRHSIVKNAIFNRANTKTNTPVIVYTEFCDDDVISIDLLVKGAGSENYSKVKMFNPTCAKKEIFEFIKESVIAAGEKSCPPLVLGIGIGGTMDSAAVLSKKAFFHEHTDEENIFVNDLIKYLSDVSDMVMDIKLFTGPTHIASLPVALTVNCHCCRHASVIVGENSLMFSDSKFEYKDVLADNHDFIEVNTSDIEVVRSLSAGQVVLLTGEIYTARDAAHKKIEEYYNEHGKFPFEIKDKIIFYAGPCPPAPGEVIGSVGPTTSARMDAYCELFYSKGLLATIGKGERSLDAQKSIKNYNAKYFTAQGGIACLLSKCVKKSETIAFKELGTEAVRKLYVEKFPVKVVY